MKFQLLPSSFDENGAASLLQHLTCFVVDDCVAFDAGSLAMAASAVQKKQIRDVVLTHAHLDHIAGLPLFIDDLFAGLDEPIRIHATAEIVEVLERDIFNWSVYPKFSELSNKNGCVMEYRKFRPGVEFKVKHLSIKAFEVNHKVPSTGFLVTDGDSKLLLTGDTSELNGFWESANSIDDLSAIFVECAFPDELDDLANISHHLTPKRVAAELSKFGRQDCPIYIVNLKPMYRQQIVNQLAVMQIKNLEILEVGRVYDL